MDNINNFNNLEDLCQYLTNSKASFGISTNWRPKYKEGTIISISCSEKYREILRKAFKDLPSKELFISTINSIYPGASELRLYKRSRNSNSKKFYRLFLSDSKLLYLKLNLDQIYCLLDYLKSVVELDDSQDLKRVNTIADIEVQLDSFNN